MRRRVAWGSLAVFVAFGVAALAHTMATVRRVSAENRELNGRLRYAAMRGHAEDVRAIVRAGANPNHLRGGWSLLMHVARGGRSDMVALLIDLGAQPNFKGKDGASALTIAAEHGKLAVTEVLLARGADVNIRNDYGNTALMYAAEYGHPGVAAVLLKAGADLTARDRDGETALMTAQRAGHAEIVRLLGKTTTE